MYFNVETLEEAKNIYRDLCKTFHPDTSGYESQKDFMEMFNEFKLFKPKSIQEGEDTIFDADEFHNLLKHFDILNNILVNFVGTFIWLENLEDNATYQQRELIKSIILEGYNPVRFAPKRKLWYFSPVEYKQKRQSKKSFESLKEQWGSKSFECKKILI